MKGYDVAVRWSDRKGALNRIYRLREVPLHARPLQLRCPGGKVVIVQKNGKVVLFFTVAKLRGPESVVLANGKKRHNGYVLLAKKGSIKKPKDSRFTNIRWRAIGQFRYLEQGAYRPVILNEGTGASSSGYLEDTEFHKSSVMRGVLKIKYGGEIPGIYHDNPEEKLIRAYVNWINNPNEFEHHYIPGPLYIDLFNRRYWRLIEAKSKVDRNTIRIAIGQLLDYKRFYVRKPSLGILVPQRPSDSIVDFLNSYKIVAIWKTPSGRFGDSFSGLWSKRIKK